MRSLYVVFPLGLLIFSCRPKQANAFTGA